MRKLSSICRFSLAAFYPSYVPRRLPNGCSRPQTTSVASTALVCRQPCLRQPRWCALLCKMALICARKSRLCAPRSRLCLRSRLCPLPKNRRPQQPQPPLRQPTAALMTTASNIALRRGLMSSLSRVPRAALGMFWLFLLFSYLYRYRILLKNNKKPICVRLVI